MRRLSLSDITWKIYYDPLFKKPSALYGVKENLLEVIAVIPLHDPRDGNWDGKVGIGEWLTSFLTGADKLAGTSELANILTGIGLDELDGNLIQKGKATLVEAMWVGVIWGFKTVYVKQFSSKISGNLVNNLQINTGARFFVKKTYETIINSTINTVIK